MKSMSDEQIEKRVSEYRANLYAGRQRDIDAQADRSQGPAVQGTNLEQLGVMPSSNKLSRSLPSTLRECARKHQSEAESFLVIAAILESSTSLNQQEQMIPFFIKALNATRV